MDYQKLLPCIHVHAVFTSHGHCNKGFDTMCAPKKLQCILVMTMYTIFERLSLNQRPRSFDDFVSKL